MNWPVFLSGLSFIFLSALPGRTTFVMLLMAAHASPLGIFVGAAGAFFIQSGISVLLGGVLSRFPREWVQLGVGLLFLVFALQYWRSSKRAPEKVATPRLGFWKAAKSAFVMVFLAEWGDVSQLAIASFSSRHPERIAVLCSAALALWATAGLAVTLGSHSRRVISPVLLSRLASFAFAAMGIYLLVTLATGSS